jgi:WD40 repeat protein
VYRREEDGSSRRTRLKQQVQLQVLRGHRDSVYKCSFYDEGGVRGKQALSCSSDNTVRMWDLETGDCIKQLVRELETLLHLTRELIMPT